MDAAFAAEVQALSRLIDEMNYYQILRVPKNASLGQVRKAYHEQSLKFHPDRFFMLQDAALKADIKKVAKRVTEAYVTLRDPQKRRAYDLQLERIQAAPPPAASAAAPAATSAAESPARPPAASALRFTEQTEKAFKQEKQQQFGKTEKGRKLYQQGMREFQAKNFVAAERTFKMALAYEPDNELFLKMRDEAGRNIKTDYTIK
jgi:curved DNA-binding protein CbpA